ECVVGEDPTYSPVYVNGAQHVLIHLLLPWLLNRALTTGDISKLLRPVHGHQMEKAAVEMAVLDAELRDQGQSFARFFGAVRDEVDCGVSVGIQPSIAALLSTVGGYLDQGYRRIKLKIKPGWDVEPVRAVRERFGDIPLQVDANTAYTLADATHLAKLDPFALLLIEQPMPEEQVLAHAELAKTVRTPICLDESIHSLQAASDAIELGACRIINLKPGRVGGYLEARRIHDLCAARGLPVWMGGMLETSIGRAGNAEPVLDRGEQRVVVVCHFARARQCVGLDDQRQHRVGAVLSLVPGDEQHAAILPCRGGQDRRHRLRQPSVGD